MTGPDGTIASDFNGTLLLDLYDADRSTVLEGSEYKTMLPFDDTVTSYTPDRAA